MVRPVIDLMVGLCLLLSAATFAAADTGPEQLNRFLQDIETLTARFEQSVEAPEQGNRMQGYGRFYLQRPGQFRWEYTQPDQLIVADGKRIWLYDRELEQISHRSEESALEGTPAMLLSSNAPLEESFQVLDAGQRDGYAWAELRPTNEESEFTRILVAFASNQLQRMDIADKFGQITRFRFFQVQRNPVLDPMLFRFDPTQGVDLIDY